jgi:NAD(P)-dependent dehydrogenase (short-subunit alcohol dehydrogenase family)
VGDRLQGKVCVITGTGGSIGRAVALRFASEGASVVGCDLCPESAEETVRLVRAAGGTMVPLHPAELGAMRDCERVIDLAGGKFGRGDVLFRPRVLYEQSGVAAPRP